MIKYMIPLFCLLLGLSACSGITVVVDKDNCRVSKLNPKKLICRDAQEVEEKQLQEP